MNYEISHVERLTCFFGGWPSIHDAELIDVHRSVNSSETDRFRRTVPSLKLLMLRPSGPILRSKKKQVSVSKICSRFAVISQ